MLYKSLCPLSNIRKTVYNIYLKDRHQRIMKLWVCWKDFCLRVSYQLYKNYQYTDIFALLYKYKNINSS